MIAIRNFCTIIIGQPHKSKPTKKTLVRNSTTRHQQRTYNEHAKKTSARWWRSPGAPTTTTNKQTNKRRRRRRRVSNKKHPYARFLNYQRDGKEKEKERVFPFPFPSFSFSFPGQILGHRCSPSLRVWKRLIFGTECPDGVAAGYWWPPVTAGTHHRGQEGTTTTTTLIHDSRYHIPHPPFHQWCFDSVFPMLGTLWSQSSYPLLSFLPRVMILLDTSGCPKMGEKHYSE